METALKCPSSDFMVRHLGLPESSRVVASTKTENVGPFRATGLSPALESLKNIFLEVKNDHSDLFQLLSTAGMRNVRNIRGYRNKFSNHSWGIAIDMKIGQGGLVPLGADWAYRGLVVLYPYFHKYGWYWGGGYSHRKDSMHFECSSSLIESFSI